MKVSAFKPHFVVEDGDDHPEEITSEDLLMETFKMHAVTDSESENNAYSEESGAKDGLKRLADFIKKESHKRTNLNLSKTDAKAFKKYLRVSNFHEILGIRGSNYKKVA